VADIVSRGEAEIRSTSAAWLIGGGGMATLVRALDWMQTPLGPTETWSPARHEASLGAWQAISRMLAGNPANPGTADRCSIQWRPGHLDG
jgi:hypothetical protein